MSRPSVHRVLRALPVRAFAFGGGTRTLASFRRLLDADVLVASHHGSADANDTRTASRWYRTVTPRLLLISANGVQHPYAGVLRFAAAQGVPTYCTSTAGSISVRATLDGRWRVNRERTAPCRPGSERPR